jgi:hypothetical protein
MSTHLSTGAQIAVSAGLPSVYDDNISTGYRSLSFTTIGEAIDIGELGIAFNVVEHQAVARRYATKKKGIYSHDDVAITCGLDVDDAGQIVVDAALASDSSYAFRIIDTDGTAYYFTGKVISAKPGPWAGDGTVTKALAVSVDPQTGAKGLYSTQYTVTYLAGTNGAIIGDAVQVVASGGSTTPVYASPDALYAFTEWTEDSGVDNPRSDTGVVANATYTATFTLIP